MTNPISESVAKVRRRYDRLARVYGAALFLFGFPRRTRRAAVAALDLPRGARALEVGCGRGANLALLVDAVGPTGTVHGIDVSTEMLHHAEKLVAHHGWSDVKVRIEDAAQLTGPADLDGVLFGLSSAVLPEPRAALDAAWRRLRPGGRLVIVEGCLPEGRLGRLLRPVILFLSRMTVLGNPDSRGWEDLAELSPDVRTRWYQFGTYYIATVVKPSDG